MALSNAERQRRKRAKAKLTTAAASVAPRPVAAAPAAGVEAAMREFLELAAAWADQQTTAQGQGIALKALKALDGIEDEAGESNLRRFAEREGVPGAWRTVDDRARRKAIEMIQARIVELRAGLTTVAAINTGLTAVAELKKRRAQFDASAVDMYIWRGLIGSPPPASLTDPSVDDDMNADDDVYTHSFEGTQS